MPARRASPRACCARARTWCSAKSKSPTRKGRWPRTPPRPTRCCERATAAAQASASSDHDMSPVSLDYRTAFELAPIGLVLSRQRQIIDCNDRVLDMFGASRALLVGRSFEVLYPTHE